MSEERRFHVDSFPRGRWQVIWYGNLAVLAHTGLYTQPTITLVTQSLDAARTGQRRRVTVPFSLIAIIPLGSIWEDGERIDERPVEDLVARKIDVTPSQSTVVRAGSRLDGHLAADYLLPFRSFSLHQDDTSAWCLRWSTDAGEIIVLPCTEAIRFYFGTSSFLLKRIMVGDPPLEEMWTRIEKDDQGHARMHLAADVPARSSSCEIARIALDEKARHAAVFVSRSARLESGAHAPIQPKMLFPFWQRSTLTVLGAPVHSDEGPPRFIVLRIDQCTAPYPFKQLEVIGGKVVESMGEDRRATPDGPDGEQRAAGAMLGGDPTNTRMSRSDARFSGPRFSDLSRKQVTYVEPTRPDKSGGGGPAARDGRFALGSGLYGGEGTPLELDILPPAPAIAFVDARLLDGAAGEIRQAWAALAELLQAGEPTIEPVLVATSKPEWLDDDSFCEVPDDVDVVRWIDAIDGWMANDERLPTTWRLFTRAPRGAVPDGVVVLEDGAELPVLIRRAYSTVTRHPTIQPASRP